ncbi:unnamed protein product [Angiostrongylus costaricensis]|uniref:Myosin-XVIIIa n=1 Tax=Angiostrongylus costaricensis TaxID=334426 RepID=A0A0R3PH73_ANGCS|nr:unnamed protein product [Angiostrongylus costaricensis]
MFFLRKGKERVHTAGSHGHKPPVPSKRSHFTTSDSESDLNIVERRDVLIEAADSIYDIPKSKLFIEDVGASEAHIAKDEVLGPSVKGFDSPKDFNIQGLTLPALAAVQVKIRTLVLHKCVTGDFGFSIRRVQFSSNKLGGVRTVVFAEPSEVWAGPPRPDDLKNRLLPGDQLIKIDGRNVDTMSREELQNAVRSAGDEIVLEVKSMPELAEFCDRKSRQSGVRDEGDQLMLGHINTTLYEDIPEDQRYWLIHKGGYTMVRLVEYLSDGRALVRIGAREMTVDSTDIDRMNPAHLDRIGDFASLRYLNETSAVHLLRQRFGSNLLYTNAGLSSIVCLASLEEDIVGEDRLVSLFKGCRRGQMPAHICATAQQIYRNLQMTGQDHCIALTGVSGSGKTTQLRKLVRYFAEVAGWTHTLPYDKLALAMGVVEAFGHASSALHRDSTRFLYLFSLGFDKAAALRTGRFQVSLLEAERLGRVCGVEAAFHVFYYLWEGADGELRERLRLDSIEQPFIIPYSKKEDKQSAKEAWERLQHAFFELGLTQSQFDAVNSVLAAILHLQAAGCTPGNAQRAHFLRVTHAQQAAALLGVSTDELGDALFRGKTSGNKSALKVANASRMALTSRRSESSEVLLSFCAGLYQELFYTVVELINKAMFSNSAFSWISVLDYPGSTFHINWTEGKAHRALGLSDLVYNYINECVTELFYNTCFVDAQELACTDIDKRSEEKRGLFAILEEESLFPGATDESLLERFFIHLGDDSRYTELQFCFRL